MKTRRTICLSLFLAIIFAAGVCIGGDLEFRRGDVDNDSQVDIFDGVWIAQAILETGIPLTCMDAADTDDNGALEPIVDAIYLLNYLFLFGPPVPAPEPFASGCGPDPTDDNLPCESYLGECP